VSDWVWAAVAVVGGGAAIGRFLIDTGISERAGRELPYGTFVVNITGALILGVLNGLAIGGDVLVIAGTATIGSYTTFSTWMLESHRLAEDGRRWLLVANVALSLLLGVGAAALGRLLGGG
jgi:CrcB protein